MNPNLASLIRHGLTAGGGFLVAKGLASTDQIVELAGAIVSIAGIVLSMWKNKKVAATTPTPPAA
jgi:hypothetical protein